MAALSPLLDEFAAKTGPEGVSVDDVTSFLGVRGFGGAALKLGVLALLPIPFLPQIAGALLIVSGALLLLGARRLWLPGLGTLRLSPAYTAFLARASRALFGWAEDLPRPQLTAMLGGLGLKLCALAILLGGMSVLLGSSAMFAAIGLIFVGFGLMEDDGAARLLGAALCLGAGAFTVTMLAGALAGAPYGAGWLETHAPWLDSLLGRAPARSVDDGLV